tara:strand:- start:574 stop:1446 length:873 start_codon:yes stop_codon:yes gene_type:complete
MECDADYEVCDKGWTFKVNMPPGRCLKDTTNYNKGGQSTVYDAKIEKEGMDFEFKIKKYCSSSTKKKEEKNLNDERCRGIFPEVYGSDDSEQLAFEKIDNSEYTSLKKFRALTREEGAILKKLVEDSIREMKSCPIADRNSANILVANDLSKVRMIDADISWDDEILFPSEKFDDEDLFYANMTYMSESNTIFSDNNKWLWDADVSSAKYFENIKNKNLQQFFVDPKHKIGQKQAIDNLSAVFYTKGTSLMMKVMRELGHRGLLQQNLTRDQNKERYQLQWRTIIANIHQ